MIMYMRRIGREGKSLLIDIMTLEVLLSTGTYPELVPYLEDGAVIYFEAPLSTNGERVGHYRKGKSSLR